MHARDFKKSEKTSAKEKWRNLFSVASILKVRCRETGGKIQKIANHINHKTCAYFTNWRASASVSGQ